MIPDWILTQIQRKSISNFDISELNGLFPTQSIDLSIYDLILTGFGNGDPMKKNQKFFVLVKILQTNSIKSLQGNHLIRIQFNETNQSQFWVNSLTNFRKEFCRFEDRLSFERSAYIILPDQHRLIRLKCVRGFVFVPYVNHVFFSVYSKFQCLDQIPFAEEAPTSNLPIQKKRYVSNRTKNQMIRNLQILFTSYLRELETESIDYVFDEFYKDIQTNIQNLKNSVS